MLDSCDSETRRFNDELLFIYVNYREGILPEKACGRPVRWALRSYQVNEDRLILEGPHHAFVSDWSERDFELSALQILPLGDAGFV